MRHPSFILFFPLVLELGASIAQEVPADSVIDSARRGRSGLFLGVPNGGALSLMHSVSLGSQANPHVFVDYGPFTNESSSPMIVSLTSKGMNGRRTLVGGFLGGARHESADSITFEVPPRTVFGFSVKDFAEISISLKDGHTYGQPTGIPATNDFLFPTGKYLRCVEYGGVQTDEAFVAKETYYIYEAGSMSDRSTSRDYINQINSRVTTGIRPAEAGVCTSG